MLAVRFLNALNPNRWRLKLRGRTTPISLVDGLALGGTIYPESAIYKAYTCRPSDDFPGFTWCAVHHSQMSKLRPYISWVTRGEYREALSAAQVGIARYEPDADLQALRAFQLSPSLALLTLLSNVYWFLGSDAEADAAMAKAQAMAEDLQHPPALVHCLCVSSYFLVFARQWTRLSAIAERAVRISAAEGFRFWEPMARICLALVEAQDGDRHGAIRRIIENMRQFRATGASIVMSQFEPALSELLIESGDPAQAVRRLSDTIVDSERRSERTYLPELCRVLAVARTALGDFEKAEQDARLRRARGQKERKARWRRALARANIASVGLDVTGDIRMRTPFLQLAATALIGLAMTTGAANAQSVMKVCGEQWKAAKAAGTTNGETWPQFLAQCRAQQKSGAATPGPTAAPAPAAPTPTYGQAPATAAVKTASQCDAEYAANKAAIKASGQTEESVRKVYEGLQSLRSMRRMEASRRNASALSVRFSKSLARRRQRLSQARVRSTTHRIGSTSNPLALSDRFTISTASSGRCLATAWANCGPW